MIFELTMSWVGLTLLNLTLTIALGSLLPVSVGSPTPVAVWVVHLGQHLEGDGENIRRGLDLL